MNPHYDEKQILHDKDNYKENESDSKIEIIPNHDGKHSPSNEDDYKENESDSRHHTHGIESEKNLQDDSEKKTVPNKNNYKDEESHLKCSTSQEVKVSRKKRSWKKFKENLVVGILRQSPKSTDKHVVPNEDNSKENDSDSKIEIDSNYKEKQVQHNEDTNSKEKVSDSKIDINSHYDDKQILPDEDNYKENESDSKIEIIPNHDGKHSPSNEDDYKENESDSRHHTHGIESEKNLQDDSEKKTVPNKNNYKDEESHLKCSTSQEVKVSRKKRSWKKIKENLVVGILRQSPKSNDKHVLPKEDNSKENDSDSKIEIDSNYKEKQVPHNEDTNSKEKVSDSKIEIDSHYDDKQILPDEDNYKENESDSKIEIIPNHDGKHSPSNEDDYKENESDSRHHTHGIESEKNLQDDSEKKTVPNKNNYKDEESHLKCSTSQEVKVSRKKRSWKKFKENLVVGILRKSPKSTDKHVVPNEDNSKENDSDSKIEIDSNYKEKQVQHNEDTNSKEKVSDSKIDINSHYDDKQIVPDEDNYKENESDSKIEAIPNHEEKHSLSNEDDYKENESDSRHHTHGIEPEKNLQDDNGKETVPNKKNYKDEESHLKCSISQEVKVSRKKRSWKKFKKNLVVGILRKSPKSNDNVLPNEDNSKENDSDSKIEIDSNYKEKQVPHNEDTNSKEKVSDSKIEIDSHYDDKQILPDEDNYKENESDSKIEAIPNHVEKHSLSNEDDYKENESDSRHHTHGIEPEKNLQDDSGKETVPNKNDYKDEESHLKCSISQEVKVSGKKRSWKKFKENLVVGILRKSPKSNDNVLPKEDNSKENDSDSKIEIDSNYKEKQVPHNEDTNSKEKVSDSKIEIDSHYDDKQILPDEDNYKENESDSKIEAIPNHEEKHSLYNEDDYKENESDSRHHTHRIEPEKNLQDDNGKETVPNKNNYKDEESHLKCSISQEVKVSRKKRSWKKFKENLVVGILRKSPKSNDNVLPKEDNSKENDSDSKIEIDSNYKEKQVPHNEDTNSKEKVSDSKIEIDSQYDDKQILPDEDNYKENESDSKIEAIPNHEEKHSLSNEDDYKENESDSRHHTHGIESEKNLQDDNGKETVPNKNNYKDEESHLKCSISQEVKVSRKKRSWKKFKKNLVVGILRKSPKSNDNVLPKEDNSKENDSDSKIEIDSNYKEKQVPHNEDTNSKEKVSDSKIEIDSHYDDKQILPDEDNYKENESDSKIEAIPNHEEKHSLYNEDDYKENESDSRHHTHGIEPEKNLQYDNGKETVPNKNNYKDEESHLKCSISQEVKVSRKKRSWKKFKENLIVGILRKSPKSNDNVLPKEDNSKENDSDSKIEIDSNYKEKQVPHNEDTNSKEKVSDSKIEIDSHYDDKQILPDEDNYKENESDSKIEIIPNHEEKHSLSNEDDYKENESDSRHHTHGIEPEKNLQDDNGKETVPNKNSYKDEESHLKCSTSQEVKVSRKKRSWKKCKENSVVGILRKSPKSDDKKDSSGGFSKDSNPNIMNRSKKNERDKRNRSVRFCCKVERYEFEESESVQENFPSDVKLRKQRSFMDMINDEMKTVPKKSNYRDWKCFKVCGGFSRKKKTTDSTETEIVEDADSDKPTTWKKVKNNFNALKGNFSKHLRNVNDEKSDTHRDTIFYTS